jgi:hypothetical protein
VKQFAILAIFMILAHERQVAGTVPEFGCGVFGEVRHPDHRGLIRDFGTGSLGFAVL